MLLKTVERGFVDRKKPRNTTEFAITSSLAFGLFTGH